MEAGEPKSGISGGDLEMEKGIFCEVFFGEGFLGGFFFPMRWGGPGKGFRLGLRRLA
ncbi:hypothetical protein DY000_02013130 [Brassica cretica]|uniref:Uncharacterized protein n=1 Tax=Brassica cretica TaxID=69181 RepID=A0ABQ7D7F0_BRACR|nr:hypothetical protein DY000_02013130 [Brassica cretica]